MSGVLGKNINSDKHIRIFHQYERGRIIMVDVQGAGHIDNCNLFLSEVVTRTGTQSGGACNPSGHVTRHLTNNQSRLRLLFKYKIGKGWITEGLITM